ncbi:hypothetical protein A4X06_0g8816, partial [Tilletia controversa]
FSVGSDTRSETLQLAVAPLKHADVILGRPWLSRHNPDIDWTTGTILKLRSTPNPLVKPRTSLSPSPPVKSSSPAPVRISVVSRGALAKLARSEKVYVAFIQPTSSPAPSPSPSPDEEALKKHSDDMLERFSPVFPEKLPSGLPPDRRVQHRIDEYPESTPVNGPLYRHSEKELKALRDFIAEEVDAGRIRPSASPYASPVLFVPKKDGTLRICYDYRALNKQTIKDRYPLPRIDDLLDRLRRAKYFSKIDLKSGYNQIQVLEDHVHKTAFKTRYGNYECLVMPFGLCNAPGTFQRLMNDLFRPFLDRFVIVYLDDILIYSETLEEHQRHVAQVLKLLQDEQLYAARQKCELFKTSTEFLGHIVSGDGVSMDPKKTDSIESWPTPKCVRDIQVFLGMANFYRRFIKNFSTMAEPLTRLLTKSLPFAWGPEQDHSFSSLKQSFQSAPVRRIFRPDLPIRVSTDSSDFGIGGVLEQKFEHRWHPIAFESRKLTPAERNYPIREKELLAIVHCLTVWRIYLEDVEDFEVFTDHHSLQYFKTQKELNKRQARWQELLCNFTYTIKYIPGPSNSVPDVLSRRPDYLNFVRLLPGSAATSVLTSVSAETTSRQLHFDPAASSIQVNAIGISSPISGFLLDVKTATPDTSEFKLLSDTSTSRTRSQHNHLRGLLLQDGLIVKDNNRLFVPSEQLRLQVLREHHDAPLGGHLGTDKTLATINRNYYWPGMDDMVRKYIKTCDLCQRIKPSTHKPYGALDPLSAPSNPWSSVSMDFITDLPKSRSGFTAIFVVVDRFSKMVHFYPCNMDGLDALATAKLFLKVIALHGVPDSIVSDRDPRFKSAFWQSLMKLLGVKLNISSAYHVQTDGQTERTNRTLEHILRPYFSYQQDDWDELLPMAEFAVNNAPSATTGVSPFQANYGRHPRTPSTLGISVPAPASVTLAEDINALHQEMHDRILKAQARQKHHADKRRTDFEFNINDLVLLSTENIKTTRPSKKLDFRRAGPFKILSKVGKVSYKLDLPSSMSGLHPVFHISMLEPYHDPASGSSLPRAPAPPPPDIINDMPEYEVETILAKRTYRRQVQYLVKWVGYPLHDATWEAADHLSNSQRLIQAFEERPPAPAS